MVHRIARFSAWIGRRNFADLHDRTLDDHRLEVIQVECDLLPSLQDERANKVAVACRIFPAKTVPAQKTAAPRPK